jgi:segregation and condensation protein B
MDEKQEPVQETEPKPEDPVIEIPVKPDSDDIPVKEEDLLKEDEIRDQIGKRIKQFRRKGGKRLENVDPFELRKSIEALLFASGRPMQVSELAMLNRVKSEQTVVQQLLIIRKDYEDRQSPIMGVEEPSGWKLTTHEKYLPVVARINPNTELSKTLMETLAVVAWKQPILQSEVIRIRTNKAYEHLSQLEEMGFLTREKHGRTQLLRLTQKFFEYFDLQGRKDLQQLFGEIQEDAKREEQTKLALGPANDISAGIIEEQSPSNQGPAIAVAEHKPENTDTQPATEKDADEYDESGKSRTDDS